MICIVRPPYLPEDIADSDGRESVSEFPGALRGWTKTAVEYHGRYTKQIGCQLQGAERLRWPMTSYVRRTGLTTDNNTEDTDSVKVTSVLRFMGAGGSIYTTVHRV